IKSCGSRVRGTFLKDVRNEVKAQFGFTDSGSAWQVAKNLTIVESLITEEWYFFHYKDVKMQTGYGDNPAIINILAAVCFADETFFGVVFPTEFKPITIKTIAFLFTLIYHCIKEWSTGKQIKAKFTEVKNAKHYKIFHADLLKWTQLNEVATRMKRGGVVIVNDPMPQLQGEAEEDARKELEAYTRDTESKDDNGQECEYD
ncbi:hypothetical protein C0992_006741, partial [Termitomyces sp. T32_za158]